MNIGLAVDKKNRNTFTIEHYDAIIPSYEAIIMARKPCEGSTTDNVLKYGVGGINIDECRIGTDYISGGTMPDLRDVRTN